MTKVFIDTGIFIALIDRTDGWHELAVELFGGERVMWSTSLLVVAEAHAWFLHRLGEGITRQFHALLGTLDGLEIFEATHLHHDEVLRKLDVLRGQKLTYVDASSLVFLERHRIRTVWGTDHHLGLTGARVLPHRG